MTLFSSRPPFNDDPEPWVIPNGYRYAGLNEGEAMFGGIMFSPRPEYDRPQHNPTNPILTEFRNDVRLNPTIPVSHLALIWVDSELFYFDEKPRGAEYRHALSVMERISA